MKRPTFLLALLCLFLNLSAQDTIPLQDQMNEAVSTLDLSQVSSGLLIDKAHTLPKVAAFDGVAVHDSKAQKSKTYKDDKKS